MSTKISSKDSTALYFVKAFAILASIAAHMSVIDQTTALSTFVTRVWDMISCISVGAFLIVGGILYNREPGDGRSFWMHKVKTMILPWIACATLTYVFRALCGVPSSFLEYINWVMGNGTLYYFVTIYLFMLLIFKPIRNNIPALWCCVAINTIVLIPRAFYVNIFSWYPFSDYLNPLHWIGFFSLGILLRKNELKLSKWFLGCCLVVFAVSAVVVYRNWIYSYFHILNAIYSVSAFFLLLTIGRWLANTRLAAPIREIGASTYCVYLLHMQIVSSVGRRIPESGFKFIFAPIIGLAVMMLLVEIGKFITGKLPFGDKLRMLVGLR